MKTKCFVCFKLGKKVYYADFYGNYVHDINKAHLYGEAYSKTLVRKFTEELNYYEDAEVFGIRVPVVV